MKQRTSSCLVLCSQNSSSANGRFWTEHSISICGAARTRCETASMVDIHFDACDSRDVTISLFFAAIDGWATSTGSLREKIKGIAAGCVVVEGEDSLLVVVVVVVGLDVVGLLLVEVEVEVVVRDDFRPSGLPLDLDVEGWWWWREDGLLAPGDSWDGLGTSGGRSVKAVKDAICFVQWWVEGGCVMEWEWGVLCWCGWGLLF